MTSRPSISDHQRAIGRVVIAAARLDGRVAFQLWSLIGSEQFVGQLITAKLGFRQRLSLLRSLVAYRSKKAEVRQACAALESRSLAAMARRDDFAHSNWGVSPLEDGRLFRSKAEARPKSGLDHSFEKVSVADIDAAAQELEDCALLCEQLTNLLLPYMHGVVHVTSKSDGSASVFRPTPIAQDE